MKAQRQPPLPLNPGRRRPPYWRSAESAIESALRRLSFCLALYAIAARLCAFGADAGHSIADGFTQTLEPTPGKGELNTQNGQADRDDNQCGTRCNDHDNTDRNDRTAQDSNRNTSCRLVSPMDGLLDQGWSPLFCIHYVVSQCSLLYDHLIVVFVACH